MTPDRIETINDIQIIFFLVRNIHEYARNNQKIFLKDFCLLLGIPDHKLFFSWSGIYMNMTGIIKKNISKRFLSINDTNPATKPQVIPVIGPYKSPTIKIGSDDNKLIPPPCGYWISCIFDKTKLIVKIKTTSHCLVKMEK